MAECKICGGTGWAVKSFLPLVQVECSCEEKPIRSGVHVQYTPNDCDLLAYIRARDPFYVQHHETQLKIERGEFERRND